jgi:long-chain acyl-CoA synthetase
LKKWCTENNIDSTSNEKMINDPAVKELYQKEIEHYNPFFNHVEQIKKFELLPNEWTVDGGEMTPKLSLRRKIVLEKNKDIISRIYA